MGKATPQATVDLIVRMLNEGIDTHQIAGVVGMTNNGIKYIRDRLKADAYHGPRVSEYDITTKPVRETDEMAERFARAMNGQAYRSLKIKACGRSVPPNVSHVMTQSSAGSCADAA